MSMETLLIIVVLVFLLGGGGWGYSRWRGQGSSAHAARQRPLAERSVRWFDAPHTPHGWDSGYRVRSLFCGDVLTQAGADQPPVSESEILGPTEAMRAAMDQFAHGPGTRPALERLAAFEPRLLACMHGASYRGDGAEHLRAFAQPLEAQRQPSAARATIAWKAVDLGSTRRAQSCKKGVQCSETASCCSSLLAREPKGTLRA